MSNDSSTDEPEAEMLNRILTTDNAESLRQILRTRLDLQSDDAVLSIGCGTGFETETLAEDVDERGRVHGIDVDHDVLESARQRCADLPQVSFERGDATDIPAPDDTYDVAVAKQVLQFVEDIDTALDELHRILELGGRAAIVEKDIDTRVIHSTDRDRMQRAFDAYQNAALHPNLGTTLTSKLPNAGLEIDDVHPIPRIHTDTNEQVERGIEVLRNFMTQDPTFDDTEIDAWERELRERQANDEFLFCGTQFLYIARKPTAD